MKKVFGYLGLIIALAVLLLVRQKQHLQVSKPLVESRMLMDTIITIRAYPINSYEAVNAGFGAFVDVEKNASFYQSESQLASLNRFRKVMPDETFLQIIEAAKKYHRLSEGYFDPSFAVLQLAYGFYGDAGKLPAASEIEKLLSDNCGFDRMLTFDDQGLAILATGSLVDFGGIAGGIAIEKAAAIMRAAGCSAFLIDDAGDIWFEGKKPDGSPWKIAVRDPRDNGVLAMIESHEPLAVSTSGDYERFVVIDGKKYGHIMCPKTGRPVEFYSSVTVIASNPVAADALSTAVFAMPPDFAQEWCKQNTVPALFLTADGKIMLTPGADKYFSRIKPQ